MANPQDQAAQLQRDQASSSRQLQSVPTQFDNLNFGQALAALQQGYAVARAVWDGFWLIEKARFTESNAPNLSLTLAYTKWGSVEPAQPYWVDLLATDWRILQEQEVSLYHQRQAVQANGVHKGHYTSPTKATEEEAAVGLNVRGYSGKWAKAKTYALGLYAEWTPAYWDAVRLHFLELGGEWLGYSPDKSDMIGGKYVSSQTAG